MTDLFERQLAERLQAHPLPEEIPDLGIRSVRLGERIRRRRIGAAVLAVVLLLIIPAASGLWRLATGTEESASDQPHQPGTSDIYRHRTWRFSTYAGWALLRKSAPCAKGLGLARRLARP